MGVCGRVVAALVKSITRLAVVVVLSVLVTTIGDPAILQAELCHATILTGLPTPNTPTQEEQDGEIPAISHRQQNRPLHHFRMNSPAEGITSRYCDCFLVHIFDPASLPLNLPRHYPLRC